MRKRIGEGLPFIWGRSGLSAVATGVRVHVSAGRWFGTGTDTVPKLWQFLPPNLACVFRKAHASH